MWAERRDDSHAQLNHSHLKGRERWKHCHYRGRKLWVCINQNSLCTVSIQKICQKSNPVSSSYKVFIALHLLAGKWIDLHSHYLLASKKILHFIFTKGISVTAASFSWWAGGSVDLLWDWWLARSRMASQSLEDDAWWRRIIESYRTSVDT